MARAGSARRLGACDRIKSWLGRDPVLVVLVLALVVLQIARPQRWASLPGLVDWQTILTLAGLLMLTRAISLSGALDRLAHHLVRQLATERALACLLVLLAALLATVLTNDVALFVVIPLTLALHRLNPLPIKRLVSVIALAVNAGSVLTPLGNPQNLFLWQRSGVSFLAFTWALAPLATVLMVMLLILTALLFGDRALDLSHDAASLEVDRPLIAVTVLAFVAFVVLADMHRAPLALLAVVVGYGVWRRAAVLTIDWGLLLIFALMFVVLRSVAMLPAIHAVLTDFDLHDARHLFAAGALLSQGMSNVPATILLAEFSSNWRVLAYAVSVGGFGLGIGSLANLIAVRLTGLRGIWGPFHLISLPFFVLAAGAGAGLLLYLGQLG